MATNLQKAPNSKHQITMNKIQNTKQNTFETLGFRISVLFGIWDL